MASEVISSILSLKFLPSFVVIFTISPFASSSRAESGWGFMTLVVVQAVENRKAARTALVKSLQNGLAQLNFFEEHDCSARN